MPDRKDAKDPDQPPDDAATADQLAPLQAAMKTLPRFTREVFLAHRLDDLSYAEIAARTGVSVRRVEREMARALYLLCRAMEEPPSRRRWWRRW